MFQEEAKAIIKSYAASSLQDGEQTCMELLGKLRWNEAVAWEVLFG